MRSKFGRKTLLGFLGLLCFAFLGGCKASASSSPWSVGFEAGEAVQPSPSELKDSILPEKVSSRPVAGLILQLRPGFRTMSSDGPIVDLVHRYQAVPLGGLSLAEAIAEYSERPGVEAVYLDQPVRTCEDQSIPNDYLFGEQWGPVAIHCPEVWAVGLDCSGVTVGVIDTGIDAGHPDLSSCLKTDASGQPLGINFTSEGSSSVFTDNNSHGSHVAGIIAASRGNGAGIAGVTNCKILPIKALDAGGGGTSFSVLQGIKYAADHGARVINLSLGFDDTMVFAPLQDAFNYASAATFSVPTGGVAVGSVILVAAGNEGAPVMSPATDPNAIAVSSTSQVIGPSPLHFWEFLSAFSCRGEKVEVSAPGGRILSTIPLSLAASAGIDGQPYAYKSGTSMATPFVSAVAAMIVAIHPDWSAAQIRAKLRESVDDLGAPGRDPLFGYGRVNALKAIQ